MRQLPKIHRKLVLVCTNCREDGTECCAQKGSVDLHKKLKEAMRAADLTVRVSKSGCLDRCKDGPTVVIQPDDIWLGGVTEEDIPEVVKKVAG
jgi:(2Fe-2S) ferredoxin